MNSTDKKKVEMIDSILAELEEKEAIERKVDQILAELELPAPTPLTIPNALNNLSNEDSSIVLTASNFLANMSGNYTNTYEIIDLDVTTGNSRGVASLVNCLNNYIYMNEDQAKDIVQSLMRTLWNISANSMNHAYIIKVLTADILRDIYDATNDHTEIQNIVISLASRLLPLVRRTDQQKARVLDTLLNASSYKSLTGSHNNPESNVRKNTPITPQGTGYPGSSESDNRKRRTGPDQNNQSNVRTNNMNDDSPVDSRSMKRSGGGKG